MRVLLSTFGSRGDVEPLAGLAVALKALGAEAVVHAPPDQEFVDLLARAGVEMAPAFYSVKDWIRDKARPSAASDFAKLAKEMLAGQYRSIYAAAEGCDAIVATGLAPSAGAAQAVAEKRGLRYEHLSLCPLYLPSHAHQPYPYPSHPHPPGADNRSLWARNVEAMNAMFGGAINAHRASVGLPPTDNVRELVFTDHPWLASDPVLWPWERTDLCEPVHTGAWILPDTRPLAPELGAFLEAGERPVYVGFGSMSMPSAREAVRVAIEAARRHGRRVVVAKGWAEAGLVDEQPDCLAIGDVNQQALFPRVAAVVHHGGAGTTTTAARAGSPQVIVPQIVDQPYWAARVAALGIGVAHDGPTPTLESLVAALDVALSPAARTRAANVASQMRADGAMVAARLLLGKQGTDWPRRSFS